MRTKQEVLDTLDQIEKAIGGLIIEACPEENEPLAVREARVRYAEGGLWLRHHIETTK